MDLINRLATLAGRGDAARLQGYQAVAAPFIEAIPAAVMTSRPVRAEWARDYFVVPSRDHPWMAAILDAPDTARTAIAISLIERAFRPDAYRDPIAYGTIPVILGKMREQIPPFDEVDLRITLHLIRFGRRGGATDLLRLLDLPVTALERYVGAGGATPRRGRHPGDLFDDIAAAGTGSKAQVSAVRGRLSGSGLKDLDVEMFNVGDTWGVAMRRWSVERASTPALRETLLHLTTATAVAPSAKWRKRAAVLVAEPGIEDLVRFMIDSSFDSELLEPHWIDASPFQPANSAMVRGAYWAAAVGAWPWVTETLGRAGLYWCMSGTVATTTTRATGGSPTPAPCSSARSARPRPTRRSGA